MKTGLDEAKRFVAMVGSPKVHVLLALSYGAGLRAGEVVQLRVGAIDSAQNISRIVQSKGWRNAWTVTALRADNWMDGDEVRR